MRDEIGDFSYCMVDMSRIINFLWRFSELKNHGAVCIVVLEQVLKWNRELHCCNSPLMMFGGCALSRIPFGPEGV